MKNNGYDYLFGWIESIKPSSDEPQQSRIRMTVDQTSPANQWVNIENRGLWVKTRRTMIEGDPSNKDAVFPKRVGLIAWPKALNSPRMLDEEQLDELGRVVVPVVPSAALDPRCNDSPADDTGCVWVLWNASIIPLQVSIRKRVGDNLYIEERPVFLKRAIAAKDWRELSARQRRSPPSLGSNVKLVIPKQNAMTSGMTVRSFTP